MSLGRQLIQNVLTSWLGYAIRILIGFAFVPYITTTLGNERYGIWVIVFQVIGYFTLFDLGLERAVIRFVSSCSARKDNPAVTRVFSTAVAVYAILGAVAMVAVVLFGGLAFDIFKASPEVISEGRGAFFVVGGFLAARLWLSPWICAIIGLQRSDITNAFDIGEEMLRVALLVCVLSLGGSLIWLATAVLGAGLLRLTGMVLWVRLKHHELFFRRSEIERSTLSDLLRYARVSLVINIAWIAVFGTDMVLLGLISSSLAAGLYAPAANLMLYLRNAINAAGTPLIPAVANLDARKLGQSIQDAYLRGIKYVSFGAVFFATGVILYARPFVHLWLAPEYAETANVMVILVVGSAFFLPQIIGNAFLFGLEKHNYLLAALGCEAALKLILSLFLIVPYGAVGMAGATAIAQIVACVSVYPYVMSRVLKLPPLRLLLTQVKYGLISALAAAPVALLISRLMPPDSWAILFANIAAVTLASALAGFVLVLDPTDRRRLLDVISSRI